MDTKIYKTTALCILFVSMVFALFGQWNSQIPQINDTVWVYEHQLVDEQTAWLGGTEFFWSVADNRFVTGAADVYFYITGDGGKNWKSGRMPLSPTTSPYLTTIHAFDSAHALLGIYLISNGQNLIYRTRNGGTSWTRIANNLFTNGASYLDGIAFKDTLDGIAMGDPVGDSNSATAYFEIYRTLDGGKSWNRIPRSNIPDPLTDEIGYNGEISRIGDHIWFGTNMGRVFSSNDGGQNWKADVVGTSDIGYLKFVDSLHGVCYSAVPPQTGKLLYTEDGGNNWIDATPPFVTEDNYYWSFCLIPQSYYLFINISETFEGGPFKSYISKDRGKTWLQIGESDELQVARFFSPQVGYAGEGQIKNQDHGTKIFTYTGAPLTGLFDQKKLKADMFITPNPATDYITLDLRLQEPAETLLLINSTNGKLILKRPLASAVKYSEQIDISELIPGEYTLTVTNKNGFTTKSIIKQ